MMDAQPSQYAPTGLTDGTYFRQNYAEVRLLKKAIYGNVHLCFHHASQCQVAIKVIHPNSVTGVRQLKASGEHPKEDWVKELEVLRMLQSVGGHPSVVRLLEDFEENGAVFIVMVRVFFFLLLFYYL
jgi:serine/threonine protein kinase